MGIDIDQGCQVEPSAGLRLSILHYSAIFAMGNPPMAGTMGNPPRAGMLSPKVAAMGATLQPLPLPPRTPVIFSSSAMLATHHVPYPEPLVGRSSSHTSHQLQQPRKR